MPSKSNLDTVKPVRSLKDVKYQIAEGVDADDWESEDIKRLLEDHAALQETLADVLRRIPEIRASGDPNRLTVIRRAKRLIDFE